MATTYPAARASAAPARTHPVHGLLSAFPLAFFVGALVTDLAYAATAEMQWANFSVWLIAAGVVMGVLAALAGIVDALVNRRRGMRPRRPWPHSLGTLAMMVLAVINGFIHSRDAWTSVVPTGLLLSAIVAVLAIVTSWMGYSLEARQEASVREVR
ncbi:DUF2231 domain-containing protein [Sphingomonas aracearum]|uniref:DUF2231 domain-containing protein n=1 Tax=Sphingomonas aracearum TaxID=2283317 RepID=A0A369W539_9SPHN|nr:DUF2231 domain-containing protein [Sphingomonas aracearum]RDE07191.1 DUF2231 domain-containing protein [Sphingomonas aracearum]